MPVSPTRPPLSLTESQVLVWADHHKAKTGNWPTARSGPVLAAPGETWSAVGQAIRNGTRGFPKLKYPDSLAKLIRRERFPKRIKMRLRIGVIVQWIKAYHARTGQWPTAAMASVHEVPGLTWSAVNSALLTGRRGLPGGQSISRLRARYFGHIPQAPIRQPLSRKDVLAFADAHHARTGEWPALKSGRVHGTHPPFRWSMVHGALYRGTVAGVPAGMTLASLLVAERGRRIPAYCPPLTIPQILAWADEHRARTGQWPRVTSGRIPGTQETWDGVAIALRGGRRGLPKRPGGIGVLLEQERGIPRFHKTRLTVEQLLQWADAHHARTGEWPKQTDGEIPEAPGEKWSSIQVALQHGVRGLPAKTTLNALWRTHRGVEKKPDLTIGPILEWAAAWKARTGRFPKRHSGERIPESPGDTWTAVGAALLKGTRGLPGGMTLAQLLVAQAGARIQHHRPPFTVEQILQWADAYRRRTGRWPNKRSGEVAPGVEDTWNAVIESLRVGRRGLPGGDNLTNLLAKHRGVKLPLTEKQILGWAKAHRKRTGKWPTQRSGAVFESPADTWCGLNMVLRRGGRGLPGGGGVAMLKTMKK